VVISSRPVTAGTHQAIGLDQGLHADHGIPLGSASNGLTTELNQAHNERAALAPSRPGRYPLIVIQEVIYIPLEAKAPNRFLQFVSAP
jgi:hypothetical protein